LSACSNVALACSTQETECSGSIRLRVEKARAIQRERFAKEKNVHTNSGMTPRLIRKHCELDAEGSGFLEHAMTGQNFSARAHDRILKVARTLADLAGEEKISDNNVLEAINYRTLDRAMWQ
jgi:magnesium chelatase family protein